MSEPVLAPFRLRPVFTERIWGRRGLAPWYVEAPVATAIGEVWLTGPACIIETGELAGKTLAQATAEHVRDILGNGKAGDFPLLVKVLFPEEKLSVQVHPDDTQAQQIGLPRGKTECWYVLEARPGAAVALGLKPGVTPEVLRTAAANNTLEELLNMLPVSVGDMVYVDAGTVHAIGPGVVLLEIQQTSDTTYRVYDYGRPRELHLEEALRVMKTDTAAGKIVPESESEVTRLIRQRYFIADRYDLQQEESLTLEQPGDTPQCLVALRGSTTVQAGSGEPISLSAGQAIIVPASSPAVSLHAPEPAVIVRTYPPPDR
jgi:mannose-6-phosphate isomerase